MTKTIHVGHVERITVKGGFKFCIYEARTPEQRGWSACYDTWSERLASMCERAGKMGQSMQIEFTEDNGAFKLDSATLVTPEAV